MSKSVDQKANVWVVNKLNIKISGSGKLDYYGSPRISSSVSGSGKVTALVKNNIPNVEQLTGD